MKRKVKRIIRQLESKRDNLPKKKDINRMAKDSIVSELSKKGVSACIVSRDVMIENKLKAKVHAKQEKTWPNNKGPIDRDLLVLVDFESSIMEPTIYILTQNDWEILITGLVNEYLNDPYHDRDRNVQIEKPYNIPVWTKQLEKASGKPYAGYGLTPFDVTKYKNNFDCIKELLKQ